MRKLIIFSVFVFLFLYILPLGVRPLVIPDEARYAEIAREMVDTGDFVVPRLNGLRYFEKPVMGYWLNAASLAVFGENRFAVRFASAACAGLSALMLFFLARRFAGGKFTAILASLIFLTCCEVFGVGVFSVLDTMFSFFLTGAMIFFYYAWSERHMDRGRRGKIFLALCGVSVGFAFLTKGFLAFVLPVAVIVPFLIWKKNWKDLYTVPWIPLAAAVAVILPWAVMIHLREPDFWHYFFWEEHIRRFMADDAQHEASFFYYFKLFPAAAMPWIFLAPTMFSGIAKQKSKNPVIPFAVCWFIFPFLFFSISKGKLLTYILPCFPPFALMTAIGLMHFLPGDGQKLSYRTLPKSFTWGAWAAAGFSCLLAIVLILMQTTHIFSLRPFTHLWKIALGIIVFLVATTGYSCAAAGKAGRKRVMVFAAAPLAFLFAIHFLYPDIVIPKKSPGAFLKSHQAKIGPDTVIISDYSPLRAVCWFFKRSDVYMTGTTGELTYGLQYNDAADRFVELDAVRKLILRNPGKVVLVAREGNFKKWSKELSKPAYVDDNGEFVFAVF